MPIRSCAWSATVAVPNTGHVIKWACGMEETKESSFPTFRIAQRNLFEYTIYNLSIPARTGYICMSLLVSSGRVHRSGSITDCTGLYEYLSPSRRVILRTPE